MQIPLDNNYNDLPKISITHQPFEMNIPICTNCRCHEYITKRGFRKHIHKNPTQIYYCSKCKIKLINDPSSGFLYPLRIIDKILDLHVYGVNAERIKDYIIKNCKQEHPGISFTRQTILNNIKKASERLSIIDQYFYHEKKGGEWQIDDCYQPLINGKVGHITNVFSVKYRYWLSSFVTLERDTNASLQAVINATMRAKYEPKIIKMDAYQPHIKAADKVFPKTQIKVKSKKEYYGWVNYIERLNRSMRFGAIKKKFCFRSLNQLQASATLTRVWYNFLKIHKSLKGNTPAVSVGITIPFHNWVDLLRYAYFLSWYIK